MLGRCDDLKGTAPFFFVTNANIRADGHQSSDQPGMFWRLIPWYPVQTCFKPKTAWCFVGNDHQVEEWYYVIIYTYICKCIIDFGRTLGFIPSFCTDHHTLKWICPLPPIWPDITTCGSTWSRLPSNALEAKKNTPQWHSTGWEPPPQQRKKKENKNTKTTATNMTKQEIVPILSQLWI